MNRSWCLYIQTGFSPTDTPETRASPGLQQLSNQQALPHCTGSPQALRAPVSGDPCGGFLARTLFLVAAVPSGASLNARRGQGAHCGLFIRAHIGHQPPPSQPQHLPEAPPPDTITLRVRFPTNEFGGRIQTIATLHLQRLSLILLLLNVDQTQGLTSNKQNVGR